ncbi:hypothetical protein H9L39_18073 [Fusarium oxysporum f. sp. albedinis]|nr:hypothetical protein H9L39_18073 [Fusarium oxysporum f. sp. albedinis]
MSSFSWLEVKPDDSGPAKVVQTAFKIKAADGEDFKPDIATRSRQEFLKLCLRDPAAVSMGSDSFFTTGDFEPAKADNGSYLRRVGLYDLRGINEPWQLVKEIRPSFMPMTKKFRPTVKKLLVARRTADKVDALANDASLLPAMIFPILTGDTEFRAPPESFNLKVGRGAAVASYVVPLPLRTSAGASINVSVKIHVYETYNDALEASAFELYKFESMPAKVVIPRSDVYGSYMVQSTKSLFMVRGNLMIDMTALGLDQYKLMYGELLKMAGRLFKYLAHRVALPFQARRPNVIVAEEWRSNSKGEYSAKDAMCVYIASGDGTSGVEQPIIFAGASSPEFGLDRRFSFYSLNKESQLSTREVHITIGVAHAETFFPAAATFTVNL